MIDKNNRIIKFRAWDKEKKKMEFYPFIYFGADGEVAFTPDENWDYIDDNPRDKNNFELMQFTGLKDKNGKEIYEKDLVKICFTGYPDAKVEGWKYKVEAIYQVNIGLFETTMDMVKLIKPEMMIDHMHFGAEDYWWDGETFKIDNEYRNGEKTRSDGEIEVIGNIYENPELLK